MEEREIEKKETKRNRGTEGWRKRKNEKALHENETTIFI
jgi:hypothetical protein